MAHRSGLVAAGAGLVLSLLAWAASYWQVGYSLAGQGTHLVLLRAGQLTLGWTERTQQRGWSALGFAGLKTSWWPRYSAFPNTFWSLAIPLWIFAVPSGLWVWRQLAFRDRQRRWGRCTGCGYVQRGVSEAVCPECGRSLVK